jgi:hypothetical protein
VVVVAEHTLVQAVVVVLEVVVAQSVLMQEGQELLTLEVAVLVLVPVVLPAVAVQAL